MLWLVFSAAAGAGLYLFLLAPGLARGKERRASIPFVPFAHRGLHGNGATDPFFGGSPSQARCFASEPSSFSI